ncbi:MAG: hypothetical protein FD146_1427 [Anaerolineaceae bacterium]|nr:MAG: hypothetical protein FD146_1427 [Anaerolineaceae bacterium]
MSIPDAAHDLVNVQYKFYKSATRLSNLLYALTIIGLILWILGIILTCVGAFFAADSVITLINSGYGY